MTASTKPSIEQLTHFFRGVESGLYTATNFQTFLEQPNRAFDENGFPVSIDYALSLDAMIAAGRYDWKNDDIIAKNFPISGTGTVEAKLRLIHFGRSVTTAEATEQILAQGLELAKIEHILAFGAKYPEKQREFPIIGLGSSWVSSVGDRRVPGLVKDGSERGLGLSWGNPGDAWSDGCRFLAVSK